MLKKIFCCLMLIVLLVLPLFSTGAEEVLTLETDSFDNGYSNEEAIKGYIERAFGLISDITPKTIPLTGINKELYDGLVPLIKKVAKGELSSTVFVIDNVTNSSNGLNLRSINKTLLANLPYDLYWYDKTVSGALELSSSSTTYTFSFKVAAEYSATGERGTTDFDTSKAASVQIAVENAQSIIAANKDKKDLAKLTAYKKAICDLVDYNDDAAGGGADHGNPWQLVWVFDNDPDTKVVCEGYSKAFKYLCDESSFRAAISVSLASGYMDGGPHMWNLVRMGDGKNYLADITNCDGEENGTMSIGYPDQLFLVGYKTKNSDLSYIYHTNFKDITYTYDSDITNYFSPDELAVSDSAYEDGPLSGTWGSLNWELDEDGKLTISGSGDMNGFEEDDTAAWQPYKEDITEVVVNASVTSIGGFAFTGCKNLSSVSLPSGLTVIGNSAFSGCSGLTSITLPDSVIRIGSYAFEDCVNLNNIVLSANLTNIDNAAFVHCSSLTSITLPDSLITLSELAFGACTGLTSITLPKNVRRYYEGYEYYEYFADVFLNCTGLTEILVADGNADFCSVNGVLFSKDQKDLICYPCGKNGRYYAIPDGVTRIADEAFEYALYPIIVYIPKSVSYIGACAFDYTYNMNDFFYSGTEDEWNAISLVDNNVGFRSINENYNIVSGGFGWCDSIIWKLDTDGLLTLSNTGLANIIVVESGNNPWSSYKSSIRSLVVGPGIYDIWGEAFANCTNLSSVSLSEGLQVIYEEAFINCSSLTAITLPASLKTIGNCAFSYCASLSSVTIPKNVKTIDNYSFLACTALKTINVNSGNANYSSSGGILFDKNKTTIICFPAGKKAANYTIPANVTTIEAFAFYECSGLSNVTFTNPDININYAAFSCCTGLTEVVFPDGFQRIENHLFVGCSGIKSITIPTSVNYIDFSSFAKDYYVLQFIPGIYSWAGSTSENSFSDIYYYGTKTQWNSIEKIEEQDLEFIMNYSKVTIHYFPAVDLTLPENLTAIESEAFAGIPTGTVIFVPASVTSIADDAFDQDVILCTPAGSYTDSWADSHNIECCEQ